MLVIVSKEFVGYLLAAIGPIALGKIYDVCHSWTMPLVLLQAGDTVVFKDLYRFTREAENGYKKYMEWLDRGINMVFLDNPTVSSDYIRQMMTTAEQQDIVTKTAMESIIKLLIIVELDRGEKQRLYISQSIKDGIAASNKKSGRKPGQLDKMSDALREDILKYLSDRSIKQVDLMRKYNISRNTLKKYVYKIQNHNVENFALVNFNFSMKVISLFILLVILHSCNPFAVQDGKHCADIEVHNWKTDKDSYYS